MTRRAGIVYARVLLGLVFLMAGSYKVLHFSDFIATLWYLPALGVLPVDAYSPLGGGIVALELFLAAMLLLGRELRLTAFVAFALLIAFTAMVVVNHEKLTRHCACFWQLGGLLPRSLVGILARNAVLLAIAGILVVAHPARNAETPSR
jgi:uncharacterized membrane protein YphA (DoxX/SURF4 family)